MKKYKQVMKKTQVVAEARCDWCKKNFLHGINKAGTDAGFLFEYGSKFDCSVYHIDICDGCFEKFILPHARKVRQHLDG